MGWHDQLEYIDKTENKYQYKTQILKFMNTANITSITDDSNIDDDSNLASTSKKASSSKRKTIDKPEVLYTFLIFKEYFIFLFLKKW